MSDLAERLKAHAGGYIHAHATEQLLREAAAELTRLRAAVTALVEAAGPFVGIEFSPMPDDTPVSMSIVVSYVPALLERAELTLADLRALSRAVEAANE